MVQPYYFRENVGVGGPVGVIIETVVQVDFETGACGIGGVRGEWDREGVKGSGKGKRYRGGRGQVSLATAIAVVVILKWVGGGWDDDRARRWRQCEREDRD